MPVKPTTITFTNKPLFVVNADGQLTTVNPLNVFGQGSITLPQTTLLPNFGNDPLGLNSILPNFWKNSIDTPIKQFLEKNDINLLVFFIGLLILILGIFEARII